MRHAYVPGFSGLPSRASQRAEGGCARDPQLLPCHTPCAPTLHAARACAAARLAARRKVEKGSCSSRAAAPARGSRSSGAGAVGRGGVGGASAPGDADTAACRVPAHSKQHTQLCFAANEKRWQFAK
eukprot:scaffold354_cov116-Isochrysis_galbana.AAC.10